MSRRRYLSTKISQDAKINRLAVQHGDFAALLYTWMIPHAEDDGRLTGDPEELLMTVMPGRRDKDVADIEGALRAMHDLGLIVWTHEGEHPCVAFPESFYAYQTYITEKRRGTAQGLNQGGNRAASVAHNTADQRESAHNTADQRTTPQNAASFTSSVKSSSSGKVIDEGGDTAGENNVAVAHAPSVAKLLLGALALSPAPSSPSSAPAASVATPAPSPKLVPLTPVPVQASMPAARSASPSARPARPPDLLWEACVAACGGQAPSNKVERGKWNKGVAALRESGATPDEVAIRAERYRRRYGARIALNPMALAGNWTVLGTEVTDDDNHDEYRSNNGTSRYGSRYGSAGRNSSGNGERRGRSSQTSSHRTYTGPHLPDADEWREWARQERAAGRPVIGG